MGGAEVSQACLGSPSPFAPTSSLNCPELYTLLLEEEAKSPALISQPLPGIKDKGRGRPKAGLGRVWVEEAERSGLHLMVGVGAQWG